MIDFWATHLLIAQEHQEEKRQDTLLYPVPAFLQERPLHLALAQPKPHRRKKQPEITRYTYK